MIGETFLDSNVLLYACSSAPAAAAELGCKTLYSEDMSHGQDCGGVRVINPFLTER